MANGLPAACIHQQECLSLLCAGFLILSCGILIYWYIFKMLLGASLHCQSYLWSVLMVKPIVANETEHFEVSLSQRESKRQKMK